MWPLKLTGSYRLVGCLDPTLNPNFELIGHLANHFGSFPKKQKTKVSKHLFTSSFSNQNQRVITNDGEVIKHEVSLKMEHLGASAFRK